MITMTFEEFDQLEEEVQNELINQDYIFPSIKEIENEMLFDKEGLRKVLLALHFSKDENYKKQINSILYEALCLISQDSHLDGLINDYKSQSIILTMDKMKSLLDTIHLIDFKPIYYFPTKEEIASYLKMESEEEIAFLFWLMTSNMELTKEEEECKNYITQIIQQKITQEEK